MRGLGASEANLDLAARQWVSPGGHLGPPGVVHADGSTDTDRIPGDLHPVGTAFATAGDALCWGSRRPFSHGSPITESDKLRDGDLLGQRKSPTMHERSADW